MLRQKVFKNLVAALSCLAIIASMILPSAAEARVDVSDLVLQLEAVAAEGPQVNLSWSQNDSASIFGFEIERSLEPLSGYSVVHTAGKSDTTYVDRNVVSGEAYYYKIRAYKKSTYSAYSNVEFADIPAEVVDPSPPTVSLTNPSDNTVYDSEQTVTIAAAVADDVGVERVDFYRNDVLVGSDSTPPYAYGWSVSQAENGQHGLKAKAYNKAGMEGVSNSKTVTVDIAPVTEPVPGRFQFNSAAYSVDEGAGKIDVTIQRVGGSDGAATVDFRTRTLDGYGDADWSSDYGTIDWFAVSFADGETSKVVSVTINDDEEVESDETFSVLLNNPTGGATLGTPVSAVVTIKDNDVSNAAPTVVISDPKDGTVYNTDQTVVFTATAQDDVGIERVEFYKDAKLVKTEYNPPYNYSWAVTEAINGAHSFTAKAFDTDGNSTLSAPTVLTVNIQASGLSVVISDPVDGTVFDAAQTVGLTATAQAVDGVERVEFYQGSTLVKTEYNPPYNYNWEVTEEINGSHSFTAIVFDTAGNFSESAPVNLSVDIQGGSTGPLPVFPGAVGFGTETPAGRGGQIIRVTNLNDSGAGSLRAALQTSGPRTVVFEVSGAISLNSTIVISEPYLTVAGQTAPSPGIMLRGNGIEIATHDVLIQHIAVRPGFVGGDGIKLHAYARPVYNIVLDHVSASWAGDEVVSTWPSLTGNKELHDVTFSNMIIAEGNNYGLLIGNHTQRISVIGNLLAHNQQRNPLMKADTSAVIANNFMYNGKYNYLEIGYYDDGSLPGKCEVTVKDNLIVDGPGSNSDHTVIRVMKRAGDGTRVHQSGNDFIGSGYLTYSTTEWGDPFVTSPPIWVNNFTSKDSSQVKGYVLSNAGARPRERDAVDRRVLDEADRGTGTYKSSVSAAGGWPVYSANHRTFDAGSNPQSDDDNDGYTNLEEILHQMAADLEVN